MPPADEKAHVCREGGVADAAQDEAARLLMAKIGKRCPACGMFIEKNAGCSHMMCGTRWGGRVEDALRNGGCAHEFDWNTRAPLKNGKPGEPFNERQVLFRPGGPAATLSQQYSENV